MTTSILTRFWHLLACRIAPPAYPKPLQARPTAQDAAALQRLIYAAGLSSLSHLCLDIEGGYDSGKCMYDSGMTSLAEALTSSTGEFKHLIEEVARERART